MLLKKIATIVLLGMLLFNWYGFRALTAFLENRADEVLTAGLDDHQYREADLVSLKVPASHLSYYNNSQQFERVDGHIEIHGLQYNYVKRRLFNDSIEMLCIPNTMAIQLKKDKIDFFRLMNDLTSHPGQGKKSGSQSFKSFSADYDAVSLSFQIQQQVNSLSPGHSIYSARLSHPVTHSDDRPPQSFS